MKLNAKQYRNAGWISLLLIVLVVICQVAMVSVHILDNEPHYGSGSFPFYIALCILLAIVSAVCFYRSSLVAVFDVRLGNSPRQELKPTLRLASRSGLMVLLISFLLLVMVKPTFEYPLDEGYSKQVLFLLASLAFINAIVFFLLGVKQVREAQYLYRRMAKDENVSNYSLLDAPFAFMGRSWVDVMRMISSGAMAALVAVWAVLSTLLGDLTYGWIMAILFCFGLIDLTLAWSDWKNDSGLGLFNVPLVVPSVCIDFFLVIMVVLSVIQLTKLS